MFLRRASRRTHTQLEIRCNPNLRAPFFLVRWAVPAAELLGETANAPVHSAQMIPSLDCTYPCRGIELAVYVSSPRAYS